MNQRTLVSQLSIKVHNRGNAKLLQKINRLGMFSIRSKKRVRILILILTIISSKEHFLKKMVIVISIIYSPILEKRVKDRKIITKDNNRLRQRSKRLSDSAVVYSNLVYAILFKSVAITTCRKKQCMYSN